VIAVGESWFVIGLNLLGVGSLVTKRTNDEWITALSEPSPEQDRALDDLRVRLIQGLGYALGSRPGIDDAVLEDFAQEAVLKILAALGAFRGESLFTSWAQKIAVRVAYTELRRHRWRDVSLDEMADNAPLGLMPRMMADPSASPEQITIQNAVVHTLRCVIDEELTAKQRQALVAVRIHGVPLEEVARRMGTNRNAVYKLLHDARQKLRAKLLDEGMSTAEILSAFEA